MLVYIVPIQPSLHRRRAVARHGGDNTVLHPSFTQHGAVAVAVATQRPPSGQAGSCSASRARALRSASSCSCFSSCRRRSCLSQCRCDDKHTTRNEEHGEKVPPTRWRGQRSMSSGRHTQPLTTSITTAPIPTWSTPRAPRQRRNSACRLSLSSFTAFNSTYITDRQW